MLLAPVLHVVDHSVSEQHSGSALRRHSALQRQEPWDLARPPTRPFQAPQGPHQEEV